MKSSTQKRIANSSFLIALLTTIPPSVAASDLSTGLSLGSNGAGVFLSGDTGWQLKDQDQFQWRITAAGYSGDLKDEKISDISYSGELNGGTVTVGLDWYPFQNSFFISSGGAFLNRDFDLQTVANKTINIGDQQIPKSENLKLQTNVEQKTSAPYASLGFGNRLNGESGFSYIIEVGALFPIDDAEVTLTEAGGRNLVTPANLEKERNELQDDFSKVQPIAMFALGYRF